MLYSVKMRSSKGGRRGEGGRHISGAERIVPEDEVEAVCAAMLRRARNHERGRADFIQIRVEEVRPESIRTCPLLPLYGRDASTVEEGRRAARDELVRAGVSPEAAEAGIAALAALRDSLRGALVLDSATGARLDGLGERGVRCTNMDAADSAAYDRMMAARGLGGDHPREALVLASKVAAAPGTVAELCWSDDPQYVTGYVGSPRFGYCRIPVLKEKGDPVGGRVFFAAPGTDIAAYIDYMQEQTVLVEAHDETR